MSIMSYIYYNTDYILRRYYKSNTMTKLLFDYCYRPERFNEIMKFRDTKKSLEELADMIDTDFVSISPNHFSNRSLELKLLKNYFYIEKMIGLGVISTVGITIYNLYRGIFQKKFISPLTFPIVGFMGGIIIYDFAYLRTLESLAKKHHKEALESYKIYEAN